MKRIQLNKAAIILLVTGISVALIAWQQQPETNKNSTPQTDTIPSKKVHNIDQALEELEMGREEMEKTLRDRNWEKDIRDAMKELDGVKIQQEIEKALKDVDAAKIQAEVQMALSKIDMEKIQQELSGTLKDIDSEKIRKEVEMAMKEVDMARIKTDVEASLSRVDMEKLRQEIEKLKEVDFKKMEAELEKIGPEVQKSLEAARKSMEAAKKELTAYKNFVDELDKAGLINKEEDYTIEYKAGVLTINGKQQPEEVTRKFDFLKEKKDFTIEKERD